MGTISIALKSTSIALKHTFKLKIASPSLYRCKSPHANVLVSDETYFKAETLARQRGDTMGIAYYMT